MAGTTTDYALPYPTGSDLVRNGDNAIQSLAEAVADLLSGTFITVTEDTTSGTQTTNSTSFTNKTDCQVTFTPGASGKFQVILEAHLDSLNTAATTVAGVDITGGLTQAATDSFSLKNENTNIVRAGTSKWFTATPGVSTTVTLAIRTTDGSYAAQVVSARIQVATVG